MPKSAYFGGHGKKVLKDMKKRYGKRAESVFYATANARGLKPGERGKADKAKRTPSQDPADRARLAEAFRKRSRKRKRGKARGA